MYDMTSVWMRAVKSFLQQNRRIFENSMGFSLAQFW